MTESLWIDIQKAGHPGNKHDLKPFVVNNNNRKSFKKNQKTLISTKSTYKLTKKEVIVYSQCAVKKTFALRFLGVFLFCFFWGGRGGIFVFFIISNCESQK